MKISDFKKKTDFLVCIDSDGTAIDSMTSKHKLCFGDCFIKEWGLEKEYESVLKLWCDINLHGATRGKNRFITLHMALEKLNGTLVNEDLSALKHWVKTSPQLSNAALKAEIEKTGEKVLKKALAWSLATNESIGRLSFADKKVFGGGKEFLEYAHGKADIAVVSSANYSSVLEEWQYYGIIGYISVLATQEDGTKAECIKKLLSHGYDCGKVIMVGDAPMDLQSAQECGVMFYPIMPEAEEESWKQFKDKYFDEFIGGGYDKSQTELIRRFTE